MSDEQRIQFFDLCDVERYRHFKGLSGADVAKTFEEYGIYGYITKYFESLHTMGDHASCRILTIILAAPQAINGSRRNCLYDNSPKGGILIK